VWCSAEHLDMTGSNRRADTVFNSEMCGKCGIHERHTDISTKFLLGDLNKREH